MGEHFEELLATRRENAALQQEVARLREELEHEQMRGDGWATTAENYKNQAESAESSLLAVREALENLFALVKGEAPSLLEDDHHYDMVTNALSTTSAQADGIKARWQAEALIASAEDQESISKFLQSGVEQWGVRDDINLKVADWLRARAAKLTAPTVAKEKP